MSLLLLFQGATARTVELILTEANDTLAADALEGRGVVAAITEAADTLSAAAGVTVAAALAVTEADDTLAAASSLVSYLNLAITEANDAMSGDTGRISARLARILGDFIETRSLASDLFEERTMDEDTVLAQ